MEKLTGPKNGSDVFKMDNAEGQKVSASDQALAVPTELNVNSAKTPLYLWNLHIHSASVTLWFPPASLTSPDFSTD